MPRVSRIERAFASLRGRGRTGLVAYVTAGDPDLAHSRQVLLALDRAGADVLEVGVPFSDPLADGPVIQRATERALAAGTTLSKVLELVASVRVEVDAPIVLFTYANPVARMGLDQFAARAAAAGVDGVLTLDLPIEEADEARHRLREAGLDTIFLLSPTTTTERIRRAAALGSGFLYGISRLGVTGARQSVASGAEALVGRIRAETTLPIAVGFGLSTPDHVAEVGRWADAAVVGSALVSVIAEHGASPALVPAVESYVRWLRGDAAGVAADGERGP
jgi:tryptophan synthase alpha chain